MVCIVGFRGRVMGGLGVLECYRVMVFVGVMIGVGSEAELCWVQGVWGRDTVSVEIVGV